MGCGGSKDETAKSPAAAAPAAETPALVSSGNTVKLLLLGPGESGKSTVFKQMKVIHQGDYSEEERRGHKQVVYGNTLLSAQVLLRAAQQLDYSLESEAALEAAQRLAQVNPSGYEFNAEIAADIKTIWADGGIRKTFARNSEYQLNDSANFFFENIERLAASDYIPATQDILRTRVQTAGITSIEFAYGGLNFKMVDVGGQRNERRKWINCFQGVTSVIFCVSLSEFDQKLREDSTTKRMTESLVLFDEICNSKWFKDTAIILFLNKTDLFRQKLERGADMRIAFPEYQGSNDFEEASDFIQREFLKLNRSPATKKVYTHMTCATDTSNVSFVFAAVKDTVMNRSLTLSTFV